MSPKNLKIVNLSTIHKLYFGLGKKDILAEEILLVWVNGGGGIN